MVRFYFKILVLLPLLFGNIFHNAFANVLIEENSELPLDLKATDVVHWTSTNAGVYGDGRVVVPLRLTTERHFAIYSNKLKFEGPPGFIASNIKPPKAQTITDPVTHKPVEVYYEGEFEITFKSDKTFEGEVFPVFVTFTGCSADICLFPYTQEFQLPVYHFEITAAETTLEKLKTTTPKEIDNPVITNSEETDINSEFVSLISNKSISLWLLLIIVFAGGILTNLTPCVYPMIPITIRVLSGQAKSPFLASSAYAAGILIVYTALGVFASLTGSLFGSLMASDWFNIAFGSVMFLFAISMLGFGNFSKLQTIGSKLGTGKASPKNAFLMGTGAGLVASPCTGPVLAALLAYTAKDGNVAKSVLLLFTYSLGFALPYVFLGGAAAKVSKVKVKPRVQIGIKLAFASIMFALALFYLRIPAYELLKPMQPYWSPIATASLSFGAAVAFIVLVTPVFYNSKYFLILPALVLGTGVFSYTQIKTENIEAIQKGVKWFHSEEEGLAYAKEHNRPVLVDAWAEWCAACKEMDATTFQDARVNQAFVDGEWVLIKLDLTEVDDSSTEIMEKYEIVGLPTLTLLKPGGSIEGKRTIAAYASADKLIKEMKTFLNKE